MTGHYIAVTESTIDGLGSTPEEAVADAVRSSGVEDASCYDTYPATDHLVEAVRLYGGGPEVCWEVRDGVAYLDAEWTVTLPDGSDIVVSDPGWRR